jgi:MFS family permease
MNVSIKKMTSSFRALRHRNFNLFISGQAISTIGTWMQNIAQPWLVLEITNNPLLLGVVVSAQTMPQMILSFYAGVIVDRIPKRKILIITQSCYALLAFTLGFLTSMHWVRYEHVLIVALAFGFLNTIDMPTRQAFMIDLVGKEDLMNAIAFNSTIFNVSRIIGPTIAGILIKTTGMAMCFYINAISYIPVVIQLIRIDTPFRKTKSSEKPKKIWNEMIDGIRYVLANPKMRMIFFLFLIISIFTINFSVLNPVLAKKDFLSDAGGLSFLMTSMGAGALVAALTIIFLNLNKSTMKLILVSSFMLAFFITAIGFTKNIMMAGISLSFVGYSMILFSTSVNTMLQLESDDTHRGRVMAIYFFVFVGITPIGAMFAGVLSKIYGARFTYLLSGLIGLMGCFITLLWIRLKNRRQHV